ncbi:MAG: GNAT family N-acetyltransferase [Novosphingobium sp.]|nr:GNAT family N-acetyltransferase [Novosphingobium sp.]
MIEYHDDLNIVQGDEVLRGLLCPAEAAAPFDRLDWWRTLSEESDILPLIAVAREGEHCAVLALRRVQRGIEALANWYTFQFRQLVSPGADAPRLLEALARDMMGEAHRITLAPLPDENGEATQLAAAFRKAGWLVFRERCDSNHVLHVDGRIFSEYFSARPGRLRTTLKRKKNKVQTVIETEFSSESWQAYEEVYASSWKPEEGLPALLRRFAEEEGRAGRLRMGVARADGEPVAAQFWTVEGGTAFIHKLAHTEQSKPISPGTTLSAALFEHVIDRDQVELIDFGTGDDGYKRDWMEDIRPRFRLDMMRPGWPGNWPAIGKQVISRLARKPNHG